MEGTYTAEFNRRVTLRFVLMVSVITIAVSVTHGAPGERVRRQTLPAFEQLFKEDVGPTPTDLIIIMDRSTRMGKNWFYLYEKKLVRQLINRYVLLYPDYVRMSIITFAREATIDTDGIRAGPRGLNKCHLFYGTDAPWHDVYFKSDPVAAKGKNVKDAFMKAKEIFFRGKKERPNAKQVLLMLTDGSHNIQTDGDPLELANELKSSGVRIYAVGVGDWLQTGNVRELATSSQFYGSYTQWTQVTQRNERGYGRDIVPIWTKIDQSKCRSVCGGGKECFCDVVSGYSSCLCPEGYEQDSFTGQCSACDYHTYKDTPGSLDSCAWCPQTQGTQQRASTKGDCMCGPGQPDCERVDSCRRNPCSASERCINSASGQQCICHPGFERLSGQGGACINPVNCPAVNPCINGDCVDSAGNYTCLCLDAYMGRHCETNINECRYQPCENGGVCEDGINAYDCVCLPGFKGRHCEEIAPIPESTTTTTTTTTTTLPTTTTTTTTTTTPTTTTTTPTTTPVTKATTEPIRPSTPMKSTPILPEVKASSLEPMRTSKRPTRKSTRARSTTESLTTPTTEPNKEPTTTISVNELAASGTLDTTTIIIIAAAGGGGLLLLLLILLIIACCCRRKDRRRRPARGPAEVKVAAGAVPANRYSKKNTRKPIVKSISQRFSGLWKSKTMRGGLWTDDDNTFTGSPSAPSRSRPDLLASSLSDPKSTTVDEILVSNEAIVQGGGMKGWVSYLNDLEKTLVINSGSIADIDGEKRACSSNYEFDHEEVDMAHDILMDKLTDVVLLAQNSEFVIDTNDGKIAVGRTVPEDETQEVIVLTHTKKFVILLIANEDMSTHVAALKREAQWISDHIDGEGY